MSYETMRYKIDISVNFESWKRVD